MTHDQTDDLQVERDHHERVRAAMATMHETATELTAAYHREYMQSKENRRPGDAKPDQNLGFAMAQFRARRLEGLADTGGPLFFGRLWLDSGESYHLGRRHIRDDTDRTHPLVVDWRAPVAEHFYRATVHSRHDVTRRRRFGFRDGVLTSFEDEDLTTGIDFDSALLHEEIERPRTGPMRDIVATIQPEQDELIRRDADTTLCVQGAPGTGKTAVGLHRAAWLLYTYADTLGKSGMLVVGPNEAFLGYIADVLPTLGETSVRQVTVGELTGADDARIEDPDAVAAIKHDARMAAVCERAVWSQLGTLDSHAIVPFRGSAVHLDVERVDAAVAHARRIGRTWNVGRKAFVEAAALGFQRQAEERTGLRRDQQWLKELKQQEIFNAFLDHMWPRLTAKQVLRRLYGDADFRASVSDGLLSEEEAALIGHRATTTKLSRADIMLLDEIQFHLDKPKAIKTYGHVVVDEAQDLSPMECRAIARRCPSGALTVLGDLAQGTTPWAAREWTEHIGHFGRPDVEFTALTTGYRVPRSIIDIANRLLPHLAVDVPPARSARTDGTVTVLPCDDLPAGAREAVARALASDGLVGVIGSEETLDAVGDALPDDPRVIQVPVGLAKGLEFDHVVLLEPAAIIDDHDPVTGHRLLYIALTRAVSDLSVVHGRPLPPELA